MADHPDVPGRPGEPDGAPTDDDVLMAELRAIGELRSGDAVSWEEPPAALWDRIAEEAGAEVEVGVGARSRSSSRARLPILAAAAVLLVALLATSVLVLNRGSDADVVASATLEQLGSRGTGSVELVEAGDRLQLRVDTSDLDPGDGFLELWVIDPDVTQLVSLGPLRSDGVHELPDGLDPGAFPIVDISVEPFDGDPTHSGDSVLRGQLDL